MAVPMTPAQLLAALKAEGLTVVEYEGWERRCRCCPDTGPHNPDGPFIRAWGDVNGGVQHITAGNLGDRTVEEYIRDIILFDKSLLTKCQFVTDPDGVVWLVAAGRANHAGGVGSKVREHMLEADFALDDAYDDRFRGSSADGNAFTYGNEAIAATRMTDDGEEDYIPDDQYDASVLLWAAIARFHGWTGQETVGHGEVSRARTKADPNLDMGQFRRDIMARVKAGPLKPVEPPVDDPPVESNVAVWGKPETWVLDATGPDVTRLGERIVVWSEALELGDPYEVGPGPTFTETDRKGLSAVQVALDYGDEPADLAKGGNSDGFPGPQTFKDLAADPPTSTSITITGVEWNVAYYNHAKGKAHAIAQVPKIAKQLRIPEADELVLIECGAGMLAPLDKALHSEPGYTGKEPAYWRVPGGGKGREIYLRRFTDIVYIASGLGQVKTLVDGDDKPYAWCVYSKAGHLIGTTAFHLESENTDEADRKRPIQLREHVASVNKIFDKYGVPAANRQYSGDGNSYQLVADEGRELGLVDSYTVSLTTKNAQYKTHNNWEKPVRGKHFDLVELPDDDAVVVNAWSQVLNNTISDHHMITTTRTITIKE